MDELILRLKSWKKGIPSFPVKIEFWPTNKCNLRCKYCRVSDLKQNYPKELPDTKLLGLVDESADLKVKEWIIAGGGEPLIRKKVVNLMMQKIKDYGMYGALTTNGTLFDKQMIERLVQLEWDTVFFSIDGHDTETNDFLKKKGSFKKAYKNLKLFQKIKQNNESDKPLIGFSSVLTNTNYEYLKELILLASDVQCKHIVINPIKGNNTLYNEKLKLNLIQIEKLRKQIPDLIKLSEKLNIKTTLPALNTNLVEKSSGIIKGNSRAEFQKQSFSHVRCYEPWTSILINPEGKIGPCCERPEDSSINVEEYALKKVWFSDYFQNIRDDILKGVYDKKCFTCNAWKITSAERIRKELDS